MLRSRTCLPGFIAAFAFVVLLFNACKKTDVNNVDPNEPPAVGDPVNIEGVITSRLGIPLAGVTIKAGTAQAITDVNGSFRITGATYPTAETFVTASLAGYFTGSRSFFAKRNSNNFLRIKLIERVEAGTLNAGTGGTISASGSTITFAPNSFVTSTGADYNGQVSIKAFYLDPSDPLLNEMMPGDLRGRMVNGDLRALQTFGMLKVELDGSGGERLQLKPASPAQIVMPVPANLQTVAPASIPLWFFDEAAGIWKEEGTAQKIGSSYKGTVSHFTFWNLDMPYEFRHLSMRIVNQAQQGLQGVKVQLTSLVDSTESYDYTDLDGYIEGHVPMNASLRRDIYDQCDSLVHTSVIGPFNSDTDLGTVVISSITNQQTISGTVTNCSSAPLASGYVIINMPGNTIYANVVNGTFTTTFTSCIAGGTATIVAVDASGQQQGAPISLPVTGSTLNAGALQACGNSANEFITVSVDGITRTWVPGFPYDFYAEEDFPSGGFANLYLSAYNNDNGGSVDITLFRNEDSTSAPFQIGMQSMSIYDQLAAPNMIGDYYLDNSVIQSPVSVLTEYGPVGQFVAGNFSGSYIRTDPSTVDTVDVFCNFRLRRDQ